jgi:nucleoside-diphosphate-sugar epimerase
MRVAVLGGTGYINGAIVADLVAAGHDVLVVHRGQREPDGQPPAEHAHVDRHDVAGLAGALDQFGAEALIDGIALTARDADDVLLAVPGALRMLVLSSADVYRAFGSVLAGTVTDDGPLDEHAPVRPERYPFRGKRDNLHDYDKLDVEERFLWRGATVIRLPMVYGERDPQRREEPALRRIRAGRTRMPIGIGTWQCGRGYVGEMARGVRLALESEAARGEIFNLAEAETPTARTWIEQIVAAAGADLELVQVPHDLLPPDLGSTGGIKQQVVMDSSKAARLLGWTHADPMEGIRRSVRWHLEHPPTDASTDFSADDRALEGVGTANGG